MAEAPCPTCKTPVPSAALYCPNCGSRTGSGDSKVEPQPALDVPTLLALALGAKYEVRRMLGEGGFAQVYEVFDTDLQRRLAVKVLKPDIAWSAGMLDRFRQECRSIARLSHPNILAIHFVGEGQGLVYYAMPFVGGRGPGQPAPARRRPGARAGPRHPAPPPRRALPCPRAGADPPRHQARQHHARGQHRAAAAGGLRHCQAPRWRGASHPDRLRGGDAAVHEPRAGARPG
jgi:hypothetical protein